jgi:hypothetical protein
MFKFSKLNNKIAVVVSNAVGTMYCAYAFALLALISLPAAIHLGLAAIISWIAQTFLQLVLLSVIMVGQNVQSKKTEKRAAQDHSMLIAELKEIKDMHADLHKLMEEIDNLKK